MRSQRSIDVAAKHFRRSLMGVKAKPVGRRGVVIYCEQCARECTEVAYRLTAVSSDLTQDPVAGHRYFHWACLRSYLMREA